jgi:hypothetical protein
MSLAIWEDLEVLQKRFPCAPAWEQTMSKGGGEGGEMSWYLCQGQLKPMQVKTFKRKEWAVEPIAGSGGPIHL